MWAKFVSKRLIVSLGVVLALLATAGAVFVWSGLYNVAASRDHFWVTTWLLETVREQSVATHSAFIETPPLDDPDLIRLGAAHYEGGCVPCHSRPGEPINAIVGQMLPSPPHLADAAAGQPANELFWIVKHGLKYTGMPAWPAPIRDDEVWALTAFLTELADGGMDNYRQLAGLDRVHAGALATKDLTNQTGSVALTQCIRCHDDAAAATISSLVPKLGGQSVRYLERALKEYAARERPSGIMQPVAAHLDDREIAKIADYYANLGAQPERRDIGSYPDPGRIARGQALAAQGDPKNAIPRCLACHSPSRAAEFPALSGQHANYLAGQLRVWQRGGRASTTYGQIMAPIARRLSEEQILDVAAYFASLPPKTDRNGSAPASPGSR
jgi:cytochrome c553